MKEFFVKAKENILKNKYYLLAFIIIWIAVVIFSLNIYKPTIGTEAFGNSDADYVVEVSKDVVIEQSIPVRQNARSFSVKFATYARKNEGQITIKVVGEKSKFEYANQAINVSDIQDNSFLTIPLNENLDIYKDTKLNITISSNSDIGKAVGVYYSELDNFERNDFLIAGVNQNGDLNCKLSVDNESYHTFSRMIIIASVVGVLLLILLLIMEVKEEVFFASMIGVFGLIFMVIMTPMSVPDEQFHYESAYQITSNILGEDHTIMDLAYRNYSHFSGHENSAPAYTRLLEHFNDPLKMREKYETVAIDIDEAQYLVYFFPQAVGVFIGRVLKWNFLRTFYFGRFTNMLFFITCIYIAIRKTPIHKTLFGILCCTPMFIQQCSSHSYDGFVNGLCLVLLAYMLKLYFVEEKITRNEILTIMITTFLLAPSKFVYGLLIVPFLFIPNDRFGGKKGKTITIFLFALPVIIIFGQKLIPQIARLINRIDDTYGFYEELKVYTAGLNIDISKFAQEYPFDPTEQEGRNYTIGFIVEYPLYTLQLIYHTVRFSIKKWFYDSLGRTLSGVSMVMPIRMIHILSLMIIVAAFVREKFITPAKIKISYIIICIIIGLMIVLGFLLSWTSRTDVMVQGVQGRYFTPLLPFFFIIFNNAYIRLPEKINKYLIFGHMIFMFEVILYILSFTFVN